MRQHFIVGLSVCIVLVIHIGNKMFNVLSVIQVDTKGGRVKVNVENGIKGVNQQRV